MYSVNKDRTTIISLLKIRAFEEKLLELFSEGKINGTTHTCIGQEEVSVAIMPLLEKEDYVFSNHRGHGHYLARFNDMEGLFAEIMGKKGAVCNGVGGSQHIKRDHYLSTGIQGESVPVAAGVAATLKFNNNMNLSVVFIGDGTWGQGAVYEALNMASLWSLPLVIICENNSISQTTPTQKNLSSNIKNRAKAFDLSYLFIKQNATVKEMQDILRPNFQVVRELSKPLIIEIQTKRIASHSKGDDTRSFSLVEDLKKNDWFEKLKASNPNEILKIKKEITEEVENLSIDILERESTQVTSESNVLEYLFKQTKLEDQKVLTNLNNAIHICMERYPDLFFIGEDVLDPYGGAFKVSKGLSSKYSKRVISTPISELGLTGFANGLVLSGRKAIVEFMFGDFIFLAFDQIINFSAKTVSMYGEKISHPIIFRCPVGGNRGYGPTHSQSVQKFFMGIPNLILFELSPCHNTIDIMPTIISNGIPSILFESKTLYSKQMINIGNYGNLFTHKKINNMTSHMFIDDDIDALLICGGSMIYDCLSVVEKLFLEYEISVHIVNPFCIYPFDVEIIKPLLELNPKVFTVEEGTVGGSWGSEVCSLIHEKFNNQNIKTIQITSKNEIIPSSKHLEKEMLINEGKILGCLLENLKE